ncbi:unnamed protein product [Orchesella dallaii]|uniref:Uncharacterized protein n=1 Tax=Orchesella dallaii TaxID=48710 RepID=A0ABP1RAF2_9HEXA
MNSCGSEEDLHGVKESGDERGENNLHLELETIKNSKIGWEELYGDASKILEQLYSENMQFLDKKESYLGVVADLLETLLSGKVDSSLYWEIAHKFKRLEARECIFTRKLRQENQWEALEQMKDEWTHLEGSLEYSEYVKIGLDKRQKILKICEASGNVAVKEKARLGALKTEWDSIKEVLNADLDNCIQRMKELDEQVKQNSV